MVEDHVRAVGYSGSILTRSAVLAHAELHVAHDDVVGTGESHPVAIDDDSLARGSLASHIEVGGEVHSRLDVDYTAHIEDHDAVGLAHGVAQRTTARVVEVGHVIDGACAATCGVASPAFSARESELLLAKSTLACQQGQQEDGDDVSHIVLLLLGCVFLLWISPLLLRWVTLSGSFVCCSYKGGIADATRRVPTTMTVCLSRTVLCGFAHKRQSVRECLLPRCIHPPCHLPVQGRSRGRHI